MLELLIRERGKYQILQLSTPGKIGVVALWNCRNIWSSQNIINWSCIGGAPGGGVVNSEHINDSDKHQSIITIREILYSAPKPRHCITTSPLCTSDQQQRVSSLCINYSRKYIVEYLQIGPVEDDYLREFLEFNYGWEAFYRHPSSILCYLCIFIIYFNFTGKCFICFSS